jgi:single-stranded-DNA-specific exonuclease
MSTVPPLTRRWLAPPVPAEEAVRRLASELRLPPPLCRLLVVRGYDDPEAARRFLRPSLARLHDPHLLAGMDAAVDRISRAVRGGETVLVHGDYDVDGMCATALYTRALRALGADVVPFVPHRVRDGYDLGRNGVRRAAEAGATLIVTADCGIVAHEAVAAAAQMGIDVVVTDHHTPAETLPEAVAVVNPKRSDCGYPDKGLSGTGVAYKVALALGRAAGRPDEDTHYSLDLVALATVADVMPLTGENRILTRFGLRVLARSRNAGLRALVRGAGLADRTLGAGHLSHGLAPRLNAVGRLEDAATGLRLLLSEDGEATGLAAELEEVNARRQAVDRQILAEALEMLEGWDDGDRAVVLAREAWHPGVIGIVASRVVERLHRPTVLISVPDGGGLARGSARSIPGFDLLDAVRACGGHLERFGGHRAAAGFDIRRDRIDGFRKAFLAAAAERLPEPPVPELRIDGELSLDEATPDLVRLLAHAGPFGAGNPNPVFVLRGVRAERVRGVGSEQQHLKLRLMDGGGAGLDAIGFRMTASHGPLARFGEPIDAAVQLQEDRWNGRRRIQARIVDLRPAP